jgi:Ricin-type beta-trefoil lectin domain
LALWDCNSGANQAWTTPGFTATQVSAGPIRSAVAGKCIDVQAGNSASGTAVQLYDCNGTAAQQWAAYSDHSLRSLGKCLQSAGAKNDGGTKLQITDCSATQAQQWVQTSGAYQNTASGRCIDDPGGTANNGTQLQIYDCNGSPAQKWSQPGGSAP